MKDISCQSRLASNQQLNAKPRNSTWIAKKRSLSYKKLFCKGSRHLSQLVLKPSRAVRISRLNLLPQWNSCRVPISNTRVKPETSRSIKSLSQWLIRNRQSWLHQITSVTWGKGHHWHLTSRSAQRSLMIKGLTTIYTHCNHRLQSNNRMAQQLWHRTKRDLLKTIIPIS